MLIIDKQPELKKKTSCSPNGQTNTSIDYQPSHGRFKGRVAFDKEF